MGLSASDLSNLSRLLDEALDLLPAEVEGWLAALSSEHHHLLPRLRDMLGQHMLHGNAGFMETSPKLPAEANDDAVARPGELIGSYRLIREIGRGGMGAVWLAERADGSFQRQVALKLPRLAWGAGLVRRMARERDIGALLEHPRIARLYDAGVDDLGRPYLALEYIVGQHLDVWCDAQSLGIPQRLRLFLQVARAVAYAHGRLVVHRDLKPSNVIVSSDGQIHLLDFGIAKLLHDAAPGELELTQEQGRILTPHYASPEQMRGDAITVQSDVYSLGVLLYELLSGQTPYTPKRKSLAALEEAIMDGEPPLCSSRVAAKATARALRGEIDAILAKTLRRQPTTRYATADAMADDIERHLCGERVIAQPDTAWYRFCKTALRHRIGFSAAGVTALAILAGTAVSWVQAHRANLEAERASAVRDFMLDLVGDAEPDEEHPETEVSGRQIVAQGIERARHGFESQPRLRAELLGELGRMQARLGETDAAQAAIKEANSALERLAPPDDPALNRTRVQLAEIALDQDKLPLASAKAGLVVAACTKSGADCAKARAYANQLLSKVEQRRGNAAGAIAYAKQDVNNTELGFGAAHVETALALLHLTVMQRNAGQLSDAVHSIDRAEAIASHQTLREADRRDVTRTRAILDLDMGRYEAARASLAQLATQSQGQTLAYELRLSSQALFELGMPAEAEKQASEAIALADPGNPTLELTLARQAHARATGLMGNASAAEKEMSVVLDGLNQAGLAPATREVLRARRYRAEILARAGNLSAADAELQSVLAAHAQAGQTFTLELAQTLELAGAVLRLRGKTADAAAAHQRAESMLEEALPADHPLLERNAVYRSMAKDADSSTAADPEARNLAAHYASRFVAGSVWRTIVDRCVQGGNGFTRKDCPMFL